MENIFRVCVAGRYYDIPTQEISQSTLESLKSITDDSNNINPRDLLRAFLESREIQGFLQESLIQATQKIEQGITHNSKI